MSKNINTNKEETQSIVKQAYGNIAKKSKSSCCSCCDCTIDAKEFAKSIGYTEEELDHIPKEANLALGCGNPTQEAYLKDGEIVLDLGSGAGFDCFLAAAKIGNTGKVIGVDMTPEMIEQARNNAKKYNIENVEFRLGEIENLPVEDNSIDVIISNCVINLSADKAKVLREIHRVLKPGGRIALSDMALTKELPEKIRKNMDAYVACISGAILIDDYRQLVEEAGLQEVKISTKGTTNCCVDLNSNDCDMSLKDSIVSIYVEAYK